MLGKPKYKYGQSVIFTMDNTELKGVIHIVDPQGGGVHWGSEVSYDIFATYKGKKTLCKHVAESLVEADE